jgi:hypothetical protein
MRNDDLIGDDYTIPGLFSCIGLESLYRRLGSSRKYEALYLSRYPFGIHYLLAAMI